VSLNHMNTSWIGWKLFMGLFQNLILTMVYDKNLEIWIWFLFFYELFFSTLMLLNSSSPSSTKLSLIKQSHIRLIKFVIFLIEQSHSTISWIWDSSTKLRFLHVNTHSTIWKFMRVHKTFMLRFVRLFNFNFLVVLLVFGFVIFIDSGSVMFIFLVCFVMNLMMNSDEDLGLSLKLWKFVLVVLGIVLDDVVIQLRKMKMFFEEEDFEDKINKF
jgi:hypothetical protein